MLAADFVIVWEDDSLFAREEWRILIPPLACPVKVRGRSNSYLVGKFFARKCRQQVVRVLFAFTDKNFVRDQELGETIQWFLNIPELVFVSALSRLPLHKSLAGIAYFLKNDSTLGIVVLIDCLRLLRRGEKLLAVSQ